MGEHQFKGQVALVNAAAGTGIGAAVVEVVMFLASIASAHVSGEVIRVAC